VAALPQEKLTSDLLDGEWHARYPTASRTLCGLVAPEKRAGGHRYPPSCPECSAVVRAWRAIEAKCAPSRWPL
jgi:hypothetical protein